MTARLPSVVRVIIMHLQQDITRGQTIPEHRAREFGRKNNGSEAVAFGCLGEVRPEYGLTGNDDANFTAEVPLTVVLAFSVRVRLWKEWRGGYLGRLSRCIQWKRALWVLTLDETVVRGWEC